MSEPPVIAGNGGRGASPVGWSPERLRAEADAIAWYHSIDLGKGVTTRGLSVTPRIGPSQLPELQGKSVLDIGAWDGYYSFQAERLGARRVVAMDHYVWGVDIPARQKYWEQCSVKGELPDHAKDLSDFWLPDLPGKRGFDFAHRVLQSRVESRVADFATEDERSIGLFDVTFLFGVLYHMKEPLRILEKLRAVTAEVAVVETVLLEVEGFESASFLEFTAGASFQTDFGNWYLPSIEALRELCRAAGFGRVAVVVGPSDHNRRRVGLLRRRSNQVRRDHRAVVHAYV
jgi:tRNA (mo5U34)-methyltransferase